MEPTIRKAINDDFVISNHVLVKYVGSEAEVIIPDEVLEIGDRAFAKDGPMILTPNNTLVSVVMHNVRRIGKGAFYGCSALKNVSMSNALESVGEMAFAFSGIQNIYFPDNVIVFEDCVFMNCDYLKTVRLPAGLGNIPDGMFFNCRCLEYLTIPKKVKTIRDNAFWHCISLKHIVIPESVEYIGKEAFAKCKYLTDVWIMGAPELDNTVFDESGYQESPHAKRTELSLEHSIFDQETGQYVGVTPNKHSMTDTENDISVTQPYYTMFGKMNHRRMPQTERTETPIERSGFDQETNQYVGITADKRSLSDIENDISRTQTELAEVKKRYDKLSAQLEALNSKKKEYNMKHIMEAFANSGKSIEELLAFLNT